MPLYKITSESTILRKKVVLLNIKKKGSCNYYM